MRTRRPVSAAAIRRLQKRLGQRLKARRIELGLYQERVAKACKLSPSYLSQLEAGLRNPTIGVLYRLGKVLGVKLEDLFR
jgi:transcriptional regulator with XRE-family HTH domain